MFGNSSGGVLMKRLLLSILFVAVMSVAVSALTASIGNARMILHTDVEEGTPTVLQKSIKINNVNNLSVEVTLIPTGDIEDFTQVLDNNIILAPGQSKDARFVMSLEYGGKYEGKILVNFKSAEEGVKAQPVGLASSIIIIATGPENPNPPQKEDPETPEQPEETPDEPEEAEPEEEPEEITTGEPEEPTPKPAGEPKSNPFVGIMIVLVMLGLGAGAYWWTMRK
jgi:hypothetical protein